jgi:hypothetical protein
MLNDITVNVTHQQLKNGMNKSDLYGWQIGICTFSHRHFASSHDPCAPAALLIIKPRLRGSMMLCAEIVK